MAEAVWQAFCDKMRRDQLCEDDFAAEMRPFLQPLLCGPNAAARREKFLSSPHTCFAQETRCSILLDCPDDTYRFDFYLDNGRWQLQFIECITLPVSDICNLPYTGFQALPHKEADIRSEKEITRMIYYYTAFKKLLGPQKATEMFYDGASEALCARSWTPFYPQRLSCIAYAAWLEARIHAEQIAIVRFDAQCCCLRFCRHGWRRMYHMTAHLQKMIGYEEYIGLFEAIWRDRAAAYGWQIRFDYFDDDRTDLVFTCPAR